MRRTLGLAAACAVAGLGYAAGQLINAFVDVYNAVSLAHVMPLGADDLDKVAGDIAFRYSRVGDQFLELSQALDLHEVLVHDPTLVFLDACRNMPLVRGFRSPTRGLAPMDAPNGSFIAYSTAPGRRRRTTRGRRSCWSWTTP